MSNVWTETIGGFFSGYDPKKPGPLPSSKDNLLGKKHFQNRKRIDFCNTGDVKLDQLAEKDVHPLARPPNPFWLGESMDIKRQFIVDQPPQMSIRIAGMEM